MKEPSKEFIEAWEKHTGLECLLIIKAGFVIPTGILKRDGMLLSRTPPNPSLKRMRRNQCMVVSFVSI